MREEAKRHGSPAPVFETTGFFTAIFRPLATHTPEVTEQVAGEVAGEVLRLLKALQPGPMFRSKAQATLSLIGEANFRDRYLDPALKMGLVKMTIPDKPRSPKQRYRITPLGLEVLKKSKEKQ